MSKCDTFIAAMYALAAHDILSAAVTAFLHVIRG
jgi:hypothetical protein